MIPYTSRILDNKFPENVEILRGKDDLVGEFKRVCEEKDISVAHTKSISQQYDNVQATVSDMESYQIKLQSRIDNITSELVVSCESADKIKTYWTRTSILKFHLENMHNN